jgi:hypothetical protein
MIMAFLTAVAQQMREQYSPLVTGAGALDHHDLVGGIAPVPCLSRCSSSIWVMTVVPLWPKSPSSIKRYGAGGDDDAADRFLICRPSCSMDCTEIADIAGDLGDLLRRSAR